MWPHGARSVSHWDYRWSCQKRSPWKKKSSFKMQWSLWFKNGNWKVFRSLLLSILRFRVKRTKRRRMLNPVDVFICLSAQPRTSTHLRPPYRPEKLISVQPLTTPTNNWPLTDNWRRLSFTTRLPWRSWEENEQLKICFGTSSCFVAKIKNYQCWKSRQFNRLIRAQVA